MTDVLQVAYDSASREGIEFAHGCDDFCVGRVVIAIALLSADVVVDFVAYCVADVDCC